MLIFKKGNNFWVCFPQSKQEFDDLKNLCRKHLGRSHWSVFVKNWTVRQLQPDELYLGSYERVIELRNKDVAILVQMTWG